MLQTLYNFGEKKIENISLSQKNVSKRINQISVNIILKYQDVITDLCINISKNIHKYISKEKREFGQIID